MPLYEFECKSCETTFETLILNDRELSETKCPSCAGTEVGRLLSVPAEPRSSGSSSLPSACGQGPPCGAPWCGRQ